MARTFFILFFHEDLVIYLFTHTKIKQLFCTCDLNVLKLYFKLELEIFLYDNLGVRHIVLGLLFFLL